MYEKRESENTRLIQFLWLTVENIIQQVQKSYKDGQYVAVSLRNMAVKDMTSEMPTRSISTNTNADMQKVEQDGFDIVFNAKYMRHMEKCDNLTGGLIKAYGLIMKDYCSKSMKRRVEEHPEFESRIQDDPIALLEAIETLMHDPIRARYPLASLTDCMSRVLTLRQKEGE